MPLLGTFGAGSARGFGLLSAPAAVIVDEYFEYVTLLLPGNGTNGAQNNTFLDSSTNNFTITRNGNTTQGTFSPYGSNWSNQFSSGNYVSAASNAAFGLGTEDFTIEAWVYPTSAYTTSNYILGVTGASGGLVFYVTGGVLTVRQGNVGDLLASSTTPALNTWTHVAATRSGTTLRIFVNGVQTASATNSTNFIAGTTYVANDGTNQAPWYGYISNLRLVKGTAVYTSNFTPPTDPLTAIPGTSLLTCQSNCFKDNSSNAFAITVTGNTSVQRWSPFSPTAAYSAATYGGSAYFDGIGDYLTVADNAALQIGSSDFTVEGWVYPTGSPGTINSMYSKRATSSNYGNITIAYWNTGGIGLYVSSNSTTNWDIFQDNGTIRAYKFNAWNHFALVRSGSNWAFFVNGVRTHSTTNTASLAANAGAAVSIGAGSANGAQPIQGFLEDMRLVKGTAVYNPTLTTCTVPTAPLTAIANTILLQNFTNAGITNSAMNNDLETAGNAQISTGVVKYGTGSMRFDGTGDYLTAPSNSIYAFGTGNFTVECWVYLAVGAKAQAIFDTRVSGPSSTGIALAINASNAPYVYVNSAILFTSSTALTLSTWTHVAMVKASGTITLYINGTSTGSAASATNITDNALTIGTVVDYRDASATFHLNGYIDDLRITKGVGRYTANFTPPTAAFPTS